jgi:butyrate kinase
MNKDTGNPELPAADTSDASPPAREKPAGALRILAINPGSTSTKFAVYDGDDAVLVHIVRHERKELDGCDSMMGQKSVRLRSIIDALALYGIPISSFDAVAGRGGLLRPIKSGVYKVNERMLADLAAPSASIHASALGAVIAREIADQAGVEAYVVDPIVVDELDPVARVSGMPGIERVSIFHALNHKEMARKLARELKRPYESLRLVVAHMGGGISVGAHKYGRVVDVNDGLSGDGPFTPERTGSLPAIPLIKMCFSGEYTEQELIGKVTHDGGMQSYIGTNDSRLADEMVTGGDESAALVVDAMAYQVAKEIGAMAAALEGQVDAIILTGGLAKSSILVGAIKQRVGAFAPVHVFPGEDEMLALMNGARRVLLGEELPSEY